MVSVFSPGPRGISCSLEGGTYNSYPGNLLIVLYHGIYEYELFGNR
jgi:hypothetical protein